MAYSPEVNSRHGPSAKALENARSLAGHWRVQWVRRWNVARPLDGSELKGIKEALALGHPVACGLRWPKTLQGHVLREVPPPRDVFDGHSVVLVGYADDPKQNGGGMFVFRNSSGPGWGEKGYGRVSYAYVRAYANDALWLKYVPGRPEAPLERFEAESMAVISRHRCEVNAQNMAEWGGPMWGGGQQLFCRAQPGGFVTLAFSNSRRGGYWLRVLATAAPDYGVVRVALDGKHLGPKIKINICFATTDPTTQSLNRTWDWPDFAKAKPTLLSRASAPISTVCVPQGSGISRESVATVINSTRWDRYFRKRGLRCAQVIQSVGY